MDKYPLFQRNYEDSFHFSKNKDEGLYRAREAAAKLVGKITANCRKVVRKITMGI